MFRSLALLVLAAGAGALIVFLGLLGEAPGVTPEAAALRHGKERRATPVAYETFTIDSFETLPHQRALAEYASIEKRAVSMEGWVQRTLAAGDGDLHLELTPVPRTAESPDTAYVTCEVTPRWREDSRAWSYEQLLAVFRPNAGGTTSWPQGPQRVRVSGWLLYDFQYDRPVSSWTRLHGAPRVTGWEIHPVTRIEVWDARRAAYTEVAR